MCPQSTSNRRKESKQHRIAKGYTMTVRSVFALLLLLLLCSLLASARESRPDSHRRGKLFSLFNIVQFSNDPCTSTETLIGSSDHRNGTCFTSTECSDKSGRAQGNCAAGFGVCCVFIKDESGSTVSENCSYVQNEGFPSALSNTASNVVYTVEKCRDDVCLLRLDFEVFNIVGTSGSSNANEGTCLDTFTVGSLSTNQVVPVICGLNTGQHMYVDVGANSGDSATLTFAFSNAVTSDRTWDIKISQIECSNSNRPTDSSCLQYLTGYTGRIQTFNYANTADNHLNEQQYSVCVRQEKGYCCVEYTVCPDQLGTLTHPTLNSGTSFAATAGFSFDTTPGAAKARVDSSCTSDTNTIDYIAIPESSAGCNQGRAGSRGVSSRYCGQFLNFVQNLATNAPICDCTAPFTVDIFFNGVDDTSAATTTTGGAAIAASVNIVQSRGLCLEYMQVPC